MQLTGIAPLVSLLPGTLDAAISPSMFPFHFYCNGGSFLALQHALVCLCVMKNYDQKHPFDEILPLSRRNFEIECPNAKILQSKRGDSVRHKKIKGRGISLAIV